jgi:hypothetical protein
LRDLLTSRTACSAKQRIAYSFTRAYARLRKTKTAAYNSSAAQRVNARNCHRRKSGSDVTDNVSSQTGTSVH